jgi:hypothetical protein
MAKSTKFFALVGYAAISVAGCVHYVETEDLTTLKPVPVESSSQASSTPTNNTAQNTQGAVAVPNQPLVGPDGRPLSGNIARPGKPSAAVVIDVAEPLRASDGRPACGNVIGGKGARKKIECVNPDGSLSVEYGTSIRNITPEMQKKLDALNEEGQ